MLIHMKIWLREDEVCGFINRWDYSLKKNTSLLGHLNQVKRFGHLHCFRFPEFPSGKARQCWHQCSFAASKGFRPITSIRTSIPSGWGVFFQALFLTVSIDAALYHQEASDHVNYIASRRNGIRRLVPAAIRKLHKALQNKRLPKHTPCRCQVLFSPTPPWLHCVGTQR